MIGCVGILALIAPGVFLGLYLRSWAWGICITAILLAIAGAIILNRRKRRTTPQEWAVQLEKHLFGTGGQYGWKEAISGTFADQRLEDLRSRIVGEYKTLETPEKKEAFRRIVEALKRGEIP